MSDRTVRYSTTRREGRWRHPAFQLLLWEADWNDSHPKQKIEDGRMPVSKRRFIESLANHVGRVSFRLPDRPNQAKDRDADSDRKGYVECAYW